MKTLHLSIIAVVLIFYGFLHMALLFWLVPHVNFPFPFSFPFQHAYNIKLNGGGTEYNVSGSDLNYDIVQNPYWLVWSFSLYSGIIILSILAVKKLKQKK